MKISDLIERLSCADEKEVYVEINGVQYDFELGQCEETFDGFFTVFPAAIVLRPQLDNQE